MSQPLSIEYAQCHEVPAWLDWIAQLSAGLRPSDGPTNPPFFSTYLDNAIAATFSQEAMINLCAEDLASEFSQRQTLWGGVVTASQIENAAQACQSMLNALHQQTVDAGFEVSSAVIAVAGGRLRLKELRDIMHTVRTELKVKAICFGVTKEDEKLGDLVRICVCC